jgi:D-arabinose 5-phosphate isomerase GutQ
MGFEAFVLSGGSAGDHTVTGIRTDDTILMAVYFAGAGSDVTDVAEIASEFTITAADTVNNDGGTDTTSGKVLFTWVVSNEPVA